MLLRRASEICIYYSDNHDVDEDSKTLSAFGGNWNDGGETTRMGLFQRHLYDSIYEHNTTAASSIIVKYSAYGFARCRRRFDEFSVSRWSLDRWKLGRYR